MIILAFVLTGLGVWFLNQNGAFTSHSKMRLIGLAINLGAVLLFCHQFGITRGVFIYLGVFAAIGIIITLCLTLLARQHN